MRRIAVTGASGYLGSVLIKRLIKHTDVELILGFDVRTSAITHPKLKHIQQDINAPMGQAMRDAGIDSVVHLAFLLNTTRDRAISRRVNIDGTKNVLEESVKAGLSHIFFASSSTVYGAYPTNPALLTEADAMRPNKGFTYAEDKAELEGMISQFSRENPRMTIVSGRIAPVLGPNADNFVVKALFRNVMIKCGSFNPPLQYTHEEDFADIVTSLTQRRSAGVFNIASEGSLKYTDVARFAGKKMLTIPSSVMSAITSLSWNLHLQSDGTPPGLVFIKYPWIASTAKLEKELGIAPRYTSMQAVKDYAARKISSDRIEEKVF